MNDQSAQGFSLISLLLAKSRRSCQGFSLIEIMIVMSIVAVLSVIAITLYTGVQKGVRDNRRMQDVAEISRSLEVNRDNDLVKYQKLQETFFAAGVLPFDPKGGGVTDRSALVCGNQASTDGYVNACWYCMRAVGAPEGYCSSYDRTIDQDLPNDKSWMVCANLENDPGYFCRRSAQ